MSVSPYSIHRARRYNLVSQYLSPCHRSSPSGHFDGLHKCTERGRSLCHYLYHNRITSLAHSVRISHLWRAAGNNSNMEADPLTFFSQTTVDRVSPIRYYTKFYAYNYKLVGNEYRYNQAVLLWVNTIIFFPVCTAIQSVSYGVVYWYIPFTWFFITPKIAVFISIFCFVQIVLSTLSSHVCFTG